MTTIPTSTVEVVCREGQVDREARIKALQEKLARVNAEIEKEIPVERRYRLLMGVYSKLSGLGLSLSQEEKEAVSGMYLFLHIDHEGGDLQVDMVRNIPSNTDKGQGRKLLNDLSKAEEIIEARALGQV